MELYNIYKILIYGIIAVIYIWSGIPRKKPDNESLKG